MRKILLENVEDYLKMKKILVENVEEYDPDYYLKKQFEDSNTAMIALISSEKQAIHDYEVALQTIPGLSEEQRAQIEEILADEQDHIVLLTKMMEDLTQEKYPEAGQEGSPLETEEPSGLSVNV